MPGNGTLLDCVLQRIESQGLNLPIGNPVALNLQEALAHKSEGAAEIEVLILNDQGLAAEALRAANSPFYCGLSPVRSIRTAILRLGTQQMRRLVVLVSERAKYRAQHPDLRTMLDELWVHASTTALAAQWLSKRLHLTGIEEICFLGGLFHDIGKLLILRTVDQIKATENGKFPIPRDLLGEILETAHCPLGHRLLQRLSFPEIYCQIARDHHCEELSPGNLSLAVVRLANESSRKLGLGLNPDTSLVLPATPEAKLLQVSGLVLEELEAMLKDHMSAAE